MKLQITPTFPAIVQAQNGDQVVRANGTYTIGPKYESLTAVDGGSLSGATYRVRLSSGVYGSVLVPTFAAANGDQVSVSGGQRTFGPAYGDLTAADELDLTNAVVRVMLGNGQYGTLLAKNNNSTAIDAAVDAATAPLLARLAASETTAAPRGVYIGDSIMQFNSQLLSGTPTPFVTSAVGEIEAACSISRRYNIDSWIDLTSLTDINGANQGHASQGVNDIIARLAGAGDQAPDFVIVSVGINDVGSLTTSQIITARQQIAQYFSSRGILVIDMNLRPVGPMSAADGSQRLADIPTVNAGLAAYAATMPNVVGFDVYSVYNDGSNRPKTGYLRSTDDLHPTVLGAWNAGIAFSQFMNARIKPYRAYPQWEVGNAIPNAPMIGTSGSKLLRATGSVATGFSAGMTTNPGVVAVVISVTPNDDVSNRQDLNFTSDGSGVNQEDFFLSVASFDASAFVGQWVRAFAEVQIGTWAAWRYWRLVINGQNTANGAVFLSAANQPLVPNADTFPGFGFDLVLLTPPFLMPNDLETLSPTFNVGIDGTQSGGADIFVKRMWLGAVDDPRPLRNL